MSQSGETEGSTAREGGRHSCVINDDATQTRCDDDGKDAIDKAGVGRAAETTTTGHAAAPSTGPKQTRDGAAQTTGRWHCWSGTSTGLSGGVALTFFLLTFLRMRDICKIISVQRKDKAFIV